MSTEKNTTSKKAVNESKPKVYNWTAKRKKDAHAALLRMFNRSEPQQRNSLNVEYSPDGTALSKTIGRVKKEYKLNMNNL